ncbi:MAG: phosphoribosylaminoimidazolesuccinocarboxamide synthase [Candidatus Omnitrophica bacterium]|nr:phosphoribosylaminoimidazolesuccinocarboxamide synthase [Candidatus Omnitrophota bacterium]
MTYTAIISFTTPNIKHLRTGKVRELYGIAATADREESLLMVATDRISAFDVIMPNGIPDKGRVLTQISKFWFDRYGNDIPHHLISADIDEIIGIVPELADHRAALEGRSMLCKKATPLTIECIVRGYLAGSGWKEYKKSHSVCGIKLPVGLKESDKLPEVIFTPSTKADEGHDINITEEQARKIAGDDVFETVRERSVELYSKAATYALNKGIIICDTKFEFGQIDGELVLIDEVLTPDSSRFWPKDQYKPGRSQPSFDKQFVRDYLESLDWDKTPPGPVLPDEIVCKTREKYLQAYEFITGMKLVEA